MELYLLREAASTKVEVAEPSRELKHALEAAKEDRSTRRLDPLLLLGHRRLVIDGEPPRRAAAVDLIHWAA